ncbi:TPA: hypothetical protein ACS72K_000824 [Providencia alcalifaciens]|uniref:Lipoprotein n=1 Tax=Providencia alcalifaciens TaxID=126385 RepID=A0A4R3NV42_9GAMM|nr:hypothetical protein [Providencia alcalifaciens]TCT36575.1 hypothetical protein EC835_10224 [Providencia alcalifaciens]
MKKSLLIAVLPSFFLVACATKQYPQPASLTPEESSIMTCNDIKIEIAKTRGVHNEIERTGEFDGKTVLGFLGDFGIGNGMAKEDARKKVQSRLNQLEGLKAVKCNG